jgi:hypothetical protein
LTFGCAQADSGGARPRVGFCQPQLTCQSVLESPPQSLDAAVGLRGQGKDKFNVQG